MATEFEAPSVPQGPRVHDIGPGGVVSIAVEADDVRVRGVDGTEARVVAPADGVGIETIAEAGRLTVRTNRHAGTDKSAFVGIRIGTRDFGVPLRLRVSGTVEVDVPRDSRVVVTSAAGDVAVRDVLGGVTLRTASGDISVKGAAGSVVAEAASGDVHVTGVQPISVAVRAVSGDVRARAPRFERVEIETVSGDVELAGVFASGGQHAVSTVSGDVEVAVAGGLTLAMRTVSGGVECEHPERRDGDGRKRPLVIGDGAARLAVRTMSGDLEVRAGKKKTGSPDALAGQGFDFAAPAPLPVVPPRPPAIASQPAAVGVAAAGSSAPPDASSADVTQAAPAAPAAPGGAPSAENGAAPLDERAAVVNRLEDSTIAVLEALARGEIDVTEAERRLAAPQEHGAPADADALTAARGG